jgi:hypothetical protein
MPINTNFNISPYFDDFDETKNYYKILFRPSTAIQARELNQMQSILQKQIERFGTHIFKPGSIVLDGGFDTELTIQYVKANNILPIGTDVSYFVGKTVTGIFSGVEAYVRYVEYDVNESCFVFYVRYTASGIDSTVFYDNETIAVVGDASYNFTSLETDSTGNGSIFSIAQGVLFTKGFFAAFPAQTVVLSKYNTTPSCIVGFTVNEEIVTDLQDETLLDNALGSYNENAPGAHRFSLDPVLTVLDYDAEITDPDFVILAKFKDGSPEAWNERSQYARIYEEFAKRTYDESGDYYVKGFGLRVREHLLLEEEQNEGLYTLEEGGDSTKLSVDIEPGIAYVKGYEINKLVTEHIVTDKGIEYNSINSQIVNARNGGYFLVEEMIGMPSLDVGTVINLYNTAEKRITNKTSLSTSNTGALVGTARIKSVVYESGNPGQANGLFRVYLYDTNFVNGSISSVKSIGNTSLFFADVRLNANNNSVYYDPAYNTLLFPLGSSHTRSLKNDSGISDTIFNFHRTESKTINFSTGGILSASVTTPDEELAYSSGGLSTNEKRQLILTVGSNKDVHLFSPSGLVSGTSGQSNLTGSSTYFTRLNQGDRIKVNGTLYYVNTIYSDTSMSVVGTLSNSPVSNVIQRSFLAGDIVDLTAKGSSGSTRTATVTSGLLTIDMKEDTSNTSGTLTGSLTFNVNRSSAKEIKKVLRTNRYVIIQANTNAANTTSGPYNLGLSDVYKIRSVRMKSGLFSSSTEGTDVTDNFVLDNGQRDSLYDHAKLRFIGGIDIKDKSFLVNLDHFEADYTSGLGYFSVDSYPVDDTTDSDETLRTFRIPGYVSSYGQSFSLRNCLDFRPYKTSTATSTNDVLSATINPATTSSIQTPSGGLRTVVPDDQMYVDYSYYLSRRDVIGLDIDGKYTVFKGNAAESPISPVIPDNFMPIAKVLIKPYPSLSSTYARSLGVESYGCSAKMVANIRYTMRDIGVIKNRVDNLDYYNALTMLEKNAIDLNILDASTGLDRFKNGFFVDGFIDHSLGATSNPDYRISIDKQEQCIRPFFEMENVRYMYESTLSSGVQKTGSLITLPYTETVLLEQKNVTSRRNIEQSVYRFIGNLTFNPDGDIWCDTSTVDKTFELGDQIPPDQVMSTVWGSWQYYSQGQPVYNVYSTNAGGSADFNGSNKELEGTFSSYAEAVKFAKPVHTNPLAPSYNVYNSYEAYRGLNPRPAFRLANGQIVTGYYSWSTSSDVDYSPTPGQYLWQGRLAPKSNRPYDAPLETSGFVIEGTGPGIIERKTGVQTITSYSKQLVQFGSFVTDVSLAPYIRPQVITITARGLKARTRYWVYFDSENMTQYCAQQILNNTGVKIGLKTEGAQIITNDSGQAIIELRIPVTGKKFRVGTKEIIVTDSPTNAQDATSFAKGYWTSLGLNAAKQNNILSTVVPITLQKPLEETRLIPGQTQTLELWTWSCMAYSFKVSVPSTEDGIFLSSVDVYIESMHPTLGVWFEIREMNAGGITKNQVPYSEVWMFRNDPRIKLNPVGTTNFQATTVNFPSPVFLYNNTEYAFVIHTEGLNPDTYFWVSRLGENDVRTGNQVTSRRLTGTLYTTNNNTNYDIVPDLDLMVTFKRARFAVGTGTATLTNVPIEYIKLKSGSSVFTDFGEVIDGSDKVTLGSIVTTGNTISLTDKIVGTTSGITGNVVNISGTSYFTQGSGYINGETVSIRNSSDVAKNITATITSVESGSGTLKYYDSNFNIFAVENSNGKFFANAVISGERSSNTGIIDSFTYYPYSTTCVKPHYLTFKNTGCNFEKRGWTTEGNTWGEYYPGLPDSSSDFNEENSILSRVNEIILTNGKGSSQLRALMSTSTEYLSPVIDVSRGNATYVHNLLNFYDPEVLTLGSITGSNTIIIGDKIVGSVNGYVTSIIGNNYFTDNNGFANGESITVYNSTDVSKGITATINKIKTTETQSIGGEIDNKYVSKTVTLAEGQDAEDLIVKLTAYRPPGTDVRVYYKILNAEDPQLFDDIEWVEMHYASTVFSSIPNKYNYIEFDYQIKTENYDENGVVQYTSNGNTFKGFKQFAIKIALLGNESGTDSALIPKVADLRVIALQR